MPAAEMICLKIMKSNISAHICITYYIFKQDNNSKAMQTWGLYQQNQDPDICTRQVLKCFANLTQITNPNTGHTSTVMKHGGGSIVP